MEKIFERVKDQHVRGIYIYLNASDGIAYAEKGGKSPINKEDLVHMFEMGTPIIVDTAKKTYYRAVSIKVEEAQATLTYITTDSAVAAATVRSQEAE